MNFFRISSLALCAALAVGCSENRNTISPPAVDGEAPTLVLQFPSADSYTELAAITVRGSASDNEMLSDVLVNGGPATTVDDFATWEAAVTLTPGVNTISIDATDVTGNRTSRAISVISERGLIDRPFGSELDADNDTLYYVDINTFKIMAITLTDGEIIEFADLAQFVPTSASDTPPLDLTLDLANDAVYMTVASDDAAGNSSVGIWRYDIPTDAWSAFSDSSIDANAVLQVPSDVLLDSANNRLLVIDFVADSVVAVSLADGSQTVLTANPSLPLSEPTDAVIDTQSNRLLVTNRGSDNLVSVDLATGNHTLVSDNNIDIDPPFREALSITLDSTSSRAFIQDPVSPGLMVVDLATGLRTVLSGNSRNPIQLNDARSLDLYGNEVLALDNRIDHLIGIDLDTEVRRVISNNGFPRGATSETVSNIAATDDGVFALTSTAAVAIRGAMGIEAIAGSINDPTQRVNLDWLAVDSESLMGYAIEASTTSNSEYRVTSIDLRSGAMQIVSDGGIPNDTNPLDDVRATAVDSANSRLVVLTGDQILGVDLATGNRTVLSDDTTIPFISPRHIYVDTASSRLLVVDEDYTSLIAIDDNGDRSSFATLPAAGDSSPETPEFLAIGSDGQLWLYDESDRLMEVDAATGARTMRIDVGTRPRAQWLEMDVMDGVVYAVVNQGVQQLDLRTDESVVIYGSAPVGAGDE